MDRLMPIDLERAQLRKSFRGYETAAVDTMIKAAAESLQAALVENCALKEELERQRHEIERNRLQEDTLKDALMLAQKAADETRAAAHKHAENILEEARQAALAERLALQQQVSELRWNIERTRAEKRRFEDELRSMLDRYRQDLDSIAILTSVPGEVESASTVL